MNRFIRYGILALISIFSIGCALTPAEEGDIPDKVVAWSLDNVWKVHSGRGSGSGFALNDNYFITACHVVDGVKEDPVVTNGRDTRLIMLEVISCNKDVDVAVLKVKYPEDSLDASPGNHLWKGATLGKGVWGAGHPLGMNLVITEGHYGSGAEGSRIPNAVIITSPTIMGDSGSPVLALHNGRVVVIGLRVAIRVVRVGFAGMNLVPHLTIMTPATNIIKAIHD